MEEPELRVGGWEKKRGRRLFRRFLSLILITALGALILGPSVVEYRPAYVSSESLYFPTTWNGPFDTEYYKEFNGHLKISSISYEASDGKSGKLTVISISSLIDLENLNMQSMVVEKVESQARKEGLELENGKIINEILNVNEVQVSNNAYQWDANITESANFFLDNGIGSEILVKVYFWTIEGQIKQNGPKIEQLQSQTIICIAFGINLNTIEQATEMIGNVKI
jgi:hypothetical protein